MPHTSVEGTAAAEASVRQLIVNGKHKTALERAKEYHKAVRTAASEGLLMDAYEARIRSLIAQNLAVEAKALVDLVRERYPSASARLDDLACFAAARAGTLDDLLRPLSDPALTPERRAAIESAVQREVYDLAALAGCAAVSAEDPLRAAAAALQRAFAAVTSGPVSQEELALPEISRRSPLAPWKMLVRAVACLYRREDESCRQYLDAIKPESAPARLIPAIRVMLGGNPGARLTPASSALISRTTGDPAALRRELEGLDRLFASEDYTRIPRAIPAAVEQCRRTLPGLVERLKQHISVRSALIDLEKDDVIAAMGGPAAQDAYFLRLFAHGMELTGDFENLAMACAMWSQFRQQAANEGWFAPNGPEAAAIYLHIAEVLNRIPAELQRALREAPSTKKKGGAAEDHYFLHSEKLYERACVLDPHSEAFSQWMKWAKQQPGSQADGVAQAWHKVCPQDLDPILHLMEASEKRNSFPAALQYLAKAERIDGVHPAVRKAHLRLLVGSVPRHIQQKKLRQAEERLAEMAALPEIQQGDRPALLAALRYAAAAAAGASDRAVAHRAEIERLLGSRAATAVLTFAVARACKQSGIEEHALFEKLSKAERATIPLALARVAALAADVRMKIEIPLAWVRDAAKQFPRSRQSLDTVQLRTLCRVALKSDEFELAYAASAEGLARGGATEAGFLLLRAQCLPPKQFERRAVCAAAVVELAKHRRDMALVEEAIEMLQNGLEAGDLSITLNRANEVLEKEKAEPAFPNARRPGPDYSAMLPRKPVEDEFVDPFGEFDLDDADEDEEALLDDLPEDMPREVARILLEETKRAVLDGESLDELIARLTGGKGRGRRK